MTPGARAAVVFGSYARGSAVASLSDIDVLVLVEDRTRRDRSLLPSYPDDDLSVIVHDRQSLEHLAYSDWSFVEHLRSEHLPVFGEVDELEALLRPASPSPEEIQREISDHLDIPRQLLEPRVLGGRHLTAYSRLFATVKSAAILDGIAEEDSKFDRAEAIAGVTRRNPDLASACNALMKLEPFWLRLRRRRPVTLPWGPRDDAERLAAHAEMAVSVISRLSAEA